MNRSSPALRVYSVEGMQAQMRDNASQYFAKTVRMQKSQVMLPATLEWNAEDFVRGSGNVRDELLFFVVNCLSKGALPKLKQTFTTGYTRTTYHHLRAIKDIKYDAFDWGFTYDYIEG